MQPVVSVVISYFRQAEYLLDAVRSVLGQTYPHFEIIVVDDCCPDARASQILDCCTDSRLKVLRHEENLGLAATRNTGIANAVGELILPLNADDRLAANCLETMVRVLEESTLTAVYSRVQYFGAEDGTWLPRLELPDSLFEGTPTTFLYRKDAFDQLGGYDLRACAAPDKPFVISLLRAGSKIEAVDEPLYLRRKYVGQLMPKSAGSEIMRCSLAVHGDLYEQHLADVVSIGAAAWWREALKIQQSKSELQELRALQSSYSELATAYGVSLAPPD